MLIGTTDSQGAEIGFLKKREEKRDGGEIEETHVSRKQFEAACIHTCLCLRVFG
jgi:hypothetical protein